MKKTRFPEEQMVKILRRETDKMPLWEVAKRHAEARGEPRHDLRLAKALPSVGVGRNWTAYARSVSE